MQPALSGHAVARTVASVPQRSPSHSPGRWSQGTESLKRTAALSLIFLDQTARRLHCWFFLVTHRPIGHTDYS